MCTLIVFKNFTIIIRIKDINNLKATTAFFDVKFFKKINHLGAAALGDIGKHFPDTDPAYEGISSLKLLEHVRDLIAKKGYVIENIDATVIAQKPKLRPYIEQMEQNVADTLQIAKEQVNIKATTEEWLGFTGREEGIASQAICSLTGLYEASMQVGGGCSGCTGCQTD